MTHPHRSFWFPLLGLGFAVAGADKLLGQAGYRHMFRDWGWSREARLLIGASEFAGGVLVASDAARRLGGLLLTTASTSVLTSELQRGQTGRALPRGALLLAAVLAALPGRRAV
jgi:hypothetical protein